MNEQWKINKPFQNIPKTGDGGSMALDKFCFANVVPSSSSFPKRHPKLNRIWSKPKFFMKQQSISIRGSATLHAVVDPISTNGLRCCNPASSSLGLPNLMCEMKKKKVTKEKREMILQNNMVTTVVACLLPTPLRSPSVSVLVMH